MERLRYSVNVGDKIKDKKETSRLILFDPGIDGVDPVRLSDIGTVTYTDKSSDTYAKINGENGVLLSFAQTVQLCHSRCIGEHTQQIQTARK